MVIHMHGHVHWVFRTLMHAFNYPPSNLPYIQTDMHTHLHICIHTCTNTHKYTCTHTHTHTQFANAQHKALLAK